MYQKNTNISFNINRFFVWISLSTIFISGIHVETNYGILFFSYVLMLVVYPFLIFKARSTGIWKAHGWFFLSLFLVSFLGFLVSCFFYKREIFDFFPILVKIALLLFFVAFFTLLYVLSNRSVSELFGVYLNVSFFFSFIALVQEFYFILFGFDFLNSISPGSKNYGAYLGVAGLSVEPAFFACSLLPAGAYCISKFVQSFKINIQSLVVVLAILLSTSSLGYIGLFISALLTIMFGVRLRHAWIIVIMLPIVIFSSYKVSQLDFFQMRMNDTLSVLSGAELTMTTGMNISTYSLAVNMSMSLRALQDNYGLGAGFGSYSTVFDHYINDYEMPTYRDDFPGRGSGTSLFARLTAELGVVAWFFFLMVSYWSWRSIRKGKSPNISIAYFSTLAIILLRMGEYYVNGVVLVFLMLYWLYRESKE